MQTFGRRTDVVGGSRTARRQHLSLIGKAIEANGERPVLISNLATKGAKLRGSRLPSQDECIVLAVGDLNLPGRVAWSIETHCGIAFDEPMSETTMSEVRRHGLAGSVYSVV